jgi:hypothetical protein
VTCAYRATTPAKNCLFAEYELGHDETVAINLSVTVDYVRRRRRFFRKY